MKSLCAAACRELKALTWVEWVFLALSLPMGIGFIYHGVEFAKTGIPLQLSSNLGSIKNLAPKIFVTEIYIFALVLLCLLSAESRENARKRIAAWRTNPLFLLVAVLLVFGFFRLLPDVFHNPILVIRNAAFVWYLLLSILVAILAVRPTVVEFYFYFNIVMVFYFYSTYALTSILTGQIANYWLPIVGVYGPLLFAFLTKRWSFALPVLFLLAIGLGTDYWAKYQRTSLVGLLLITFFALYVGRHSLKRRVLPRLLVLVLFFFAIVNISRGMQFLYAKDYIALNSTEGSSNLIKADKNATGFEAFRTDMWMDAWGLFLERPFVGIGFERQVVYRISGGINGKFSPNNSTVWGHPAAPPISGPHNSYLNALTRLGVFGLLVGLIHLLALWRLWKEKMYGAFLMIYGQAIYALFNVGLEGPTRSFFLLLAIGVALKFPARKDLILTDKHAA